MKIHGLQKMTLLDFPGQVACTVFLGGCDLRCPFCHNAELLDMNAPSVMEEAELLEFLKGRKGLLDGVAFTGGEPLLRRELPDVILKIKELGYKIKIDTNGNHPDRLGRMLDEGLADYIAMDVKNCPELYGRTVGLEGFDTGRVSESIGMLLESGMDFEFRTTVVKEFHSEESFRRIGEWICGAPKYFLQAFVDRESVMYAGLNAFSKAEMEGFADIVRPYVGSVSLRGI